MLEEISQVWPKALLSGLEEKALRFFDDFFHIKVWIFDDDNYAPFSITTSLYSNVKFCATTGTILALNQS